MQAVVDSHTHFWNPNHLRYPWIDNIEKLNRTHMPEDLTAEAGSQVSIEKMVFVECDCIPEHRLDEARWVASLAEADPRIQGIVASAPLEQGEAARPYLETLTQIPLVKGVRRLIQSEPLGFSTRPDFVKGVQLLQDFGLSFDLCIFHPQLKDVTELVKQCPDITFVLNHIAKPDIKGQHLDPWRDDISDLAHLPNVMCKISGLVVEADHKKWTRDHLKPYIHHAIDVFGVDRVMFGGDWPVSTLAATYPQWVETLLWAVEHLSDADRQKLFCDNAIKFYRLD